MNITITAIGSIEKGIDGRDGYVLLSCDEPMTPEQAQDHLLPLVYTRSSNPGGYYCTDVRAVQCQYSDRQVICTVEHRYDN
jgi:hypothetical protein